MPHLEQWAVIEKLGPYQAPELAKPVLTGIVSGHSDVPDGETVRTSSIRAVEGEAVITSSGSAYTLGKPDPEYEAAFPNARARLFGGRSVD